MLRFVSTAFVTIAVLLAAPSAAVAQELDLLKGQGLVLMLRHAYAPGTGDPANFDVDRCETQRNLNGRGRDQSREWGDRLRAGGIVPSRILSSQWCRCLETAELMQVGEVEPFWPLNSFFELRQDREKNLDALRNEFASLPTDGPVVVMVTHQVTITAITGRGVSSGEGWVLKLNGTREPEVIGSIPAP
ncbi:histidine phosphatase family protein [Hwanghaeella sp.]|uniref:histidine phosphatase family protein n=1 Tax=Hwanghaeella sp. TaxID=2605943 RepID=UPI003CCB775D